MGKLVNRALRTLRDLYGYRDFNDPRKAPKYRGVYPTFAAALAALPKDKPVGFDDLRVPDMFVVEHPTISPMDYPNLFWLSQILQPSARLFDLGGGQGQCYYFYKELLPLPDEMVWTVCDVEAMALRGAELAAKRGADNLRFTVDRGDADGATVYLTNGALHYIEPDLSEILGLLKVKPQHVIVNRVPMYDGTPYYTVQNTFHSYCPNKIMNTGQFVGGMERLGYRKVDEWTLPRSLHIPFHPEQFVPHFRGFYFRLEGSQQ
jgi:putative methyltransferase (TIGR04325 family)